MSSSENPREIDGGGESSTARASQDEERNNGDHQVKLGSPHAGSEAVADANNDQNQRLQLPCSNDGRSFRTDEVVTGGVNASTGDDISCDQDEPDGGSGMSIYTRTTFTSEIEEEEEEHSSELFEIKGGVLAALDSIREEDDDHRGVDVSGSLFSFDFHNGNGELDMVYVVVEGDHHNHQGKSTKEEPNMDALLWALQKPSSSTLIFLIHVFPEIRFLPTPLGMLPISRASPEQKSIYLNEERSKRRQFLSNYLDVCAASQVKVDVIPIESDAVAKSILDLIPVLHIRKLVLGISKSNLKKMKSRRGSSVVADQILQKAPDFCDLKIICEGKEVAFDQMVDSASPSPSPSHRTTTSSPKSPETSPPVSASAAASDSFTCGGCFKPSKVAN